MYSLLRDVKFPSKWSFLQCARLTLRQSTPPGFCFSSRERQVHGRKIAGRRLIVITLRLVHRAEFGSKERLPMSASETDGDPPGIFSYPSPSSSEWFGFVSPISRGQDVRHATEIFPFLPLREQCTETPMVVFFGPNRSPPKFERMSTIGPAINIDGLKSPRGLSGSPGTPLRAQAPIPRDHPGVVKARLRNWDVRNPVVNAEDRSWRFLLQPGRGAKPIFLPSAVFLMRKVWRGLGPAAGGLGFCVSRHSVWQSARPAP